VIVFHVDIYFLQKELWNVYNVESTLNPQVKDELHEELNIEEHEVKLDR
jgi:hypothetical protein